MAFLVCRCRPFIISRPSRPRQYFTLCGGSGKTGGPDEGNNTVTWRTADDTDIQFIAKDGETLRTAALRRGIVSPHNGNAKLINCRGLGTCGTCAVEIDCKDGAIDPPERNGIENARLAFPPHGTPGQSSKLRLACQVQVLGDIVVIKRTGFWGQDINSVAVASEAKTYFGDLEFLLDRKSPKNEEK